MMFTTSYHSTSSSSASDPSSDFFSPISIAFFQKQKQRNGTSSSHEKLPLSHDSSWIGARLSPIASFDREGIAEEEEEDEENDNEANDNHEHSPLTSLPLHVHPNASYHQYANNAFLGIKETTRLLPSQSHIYTHNATQQPPSNNIPSFRNSKIHPLWNSPRMMHNHHYTNNSNHKNTWRILSCYSGKYHSMGIWGDLVCILSGANLVAMAIYDIGSVYHGWNKGEEEAISDSSSSSSEHSHAWRLPMLIPSASTLASFGAWDVQSMMNNNSYSNSYSAQDDSKIATALFSVWGSGYRSIATSWIISTSFVEWLLLLGIWHVWSKAESISQSTFPKPKPQAQPRPTQSIQGEHSSPSSARLSLSRWYEIVGIYIVCAGTGQVWTWVYDGDAVTVTGCAGWGTLGVLCATGMVRPAFRFEYYVLACFLLCASLVQRPYDSVVGATAAAFLGWSLGTAMGSTTTRVASINPNELLKETKLTSFLGTGASVVIVSLPLLSWTFQ
jgi:hypothetical protein